MRLVLASRTAAITRAAREVAMESEAYGVRADVSRPADVKRLFAAVERRLGSLDILVNSAGMAEARPVVDTSDALWNETLAANLTGTFLCTRAALRLMLARGGGHIVNIISVAATTIFANNSAYSAAKAGALAFTRVLREEVRGSGIRVTAVLPGPVDTPLWQRLWPEAPREKMMPPADVARVVLHAVSMPAGSVVEELVLRPVSGSL